MAVHDEIETINRTLSGGAAWLSRQRWFGEKTRPIVAIEPDWQWFFSPDDIVWALSSAIVRYADGGASRYFMPLAIVDEGSALPERAVVANLQDGRCIVDALHVAPVQRWWVQQMAQGQTATGSNESWRWSPIGTNLAALQRAGALQARVLTGEQSNTSLLFGRELILKVFRRLEPGINPDVEIGAYLTNHFPAVPVPRTYGDASLWRQGETYTVAAAQQFVANEGDCWQWLLRVFGEGSPSDIENAGQAMSLLGRRTGELHLALGAETDDTAFWPERIDDAFCARWRDSLQFELDLTVHLLRQAGSLPADADLAPRLRQRLWDIDDLHGTEAIRVHGDYHLGQVLRTLDGDFSILDFEGEPSRPIEDRRQRFSALKDIAGMTRSLDYARATLQRRPVAPLGDPETLDAWFARARAGFLGAYRAATRAAHGRLIPATDAKFHATLALFELEKALYETRYELNNRPEWVDIPFRAICDIAADGA